MAMISSRLGKHVRQTARAGALGLAVLAVCAQGSARAEDDDGNNRNSIWNLDQRIIGDFMRGIGLRNGNETNAIEYRERSPLVLPPNRALPAPEAKPQKDAAWPLDPELKRKRDATAKGANRRDVTYEVDIGGRALSPSELNPPGSTGGAARPGTPGSVGNEDDRLKPSELGYFGGMFSGQAFGFGAKEEVGSFTNEPPRTSLTAPPVGYQTPSGAQPYGVTKRKDVPLTEPENFPTRR
jgi:hypothetical protein